MSVLYKGYVDIKTPPAGFSLNSRFHRRWQPSYLSILLSDYYETIHKPTNEIIICHVAKNVEMSLADQAIGMISPGEFLGLFQ